MTRIILEMGTGNDLYGMDYTKAAKRAIQDALHHSSELPRGRAEVVAVKGGLNVDDPENDQTHAIATAAIEAFVEIAPESFALSPKT